MKKALKSAAAAVAGVLMRAVPAKFLNFAVRRSLTARVRSMAPEEALRFLLTIDSHVEGLLNDAAVRYDRGAHVKHRLTGYHDFFVRRIRSGERVLDIGSSRGELSADIAARAGANLIGIEIVAEDAAIANKRYGSPTMRFLHGDATKIESIPHLPDTVDVIVMSNVLEHLTDRAELLRRLAARCRPQRFLIRVPVFERDSWVPLRKELGLDWRCDTTHEIEYTLETFAEEMGAAGLIVDHIESRWGEIWAEVSPLTLPKTTAL